jgi:hypothetical protein
MNAYGLAQHLQEYANDITDYDKDYTIHAAQVLILQADQIADLKTTVSFLESECKALRDQVNELC